MFVFWRILRLAELVEDLNLPLKDTEYVNAVVFLAQDFGVFPSNYPDFIFEEKLFSKELLEEIELLRITDLEVPKKFLDLRKLIGFAEFVKDKEMAIKLAQAVYFTQRNIYSRLLENKTVKKLLQEYLTAKTHSCNPSYPARQVFAVIK